ncbi:MAG: hypothetical protein HOO95_06760 [Gallionella sp.]|nr:hypothetical protein [Gallionella sp.]
MSRLFFLLAIVVAIYLLVRSYGKKASEQDKSVTKDAAEDMVRCTHCGVHLPKGESILADGHFFCSAAHRDAFAKRR